ncbi:ATP-binding protein [Nocardioides stalactiti]|uniref:ATP-binding protein n=1 Tax=Nocardioides stalactiti TaxID=2755356 RepID=UPI001C80B314|nr:ATP-binding protein [Nocardioides stalactiti]
MSLSLRARVALAFLLTTAVAMLALGTFVHFRVEETLEDGLRDQLEAEMNGLLVAPPEERLRAVRELRGDIHGQVLDPDGTALASSPAVAEPIMDRDDEDDDGFSGGRLRVRDDLGERGERPEIDNERVLILTRTADDQVVVLAIEREEADDAVEAVGRQLLISGPVALALAGLLGYVVAGWGLRPVERMRARAATISSRSAGERLPVPPAAELHRLAVTLNAMLDRLDDGLERERRFVADASHELRTPLALLLTEVELALTGDRSPDALREALRSAEVEVRRLITLSEDLLAIASADGGGLSVTAGELDLAEVVTEVVARFQARAEGLGRSVTAEALGSARLVGDGEQLRRVTSNLVENALRHGAGDVEVVVAGGGDTVWLAVSDEGAGFTVERPLERFSGSHDSTGLGLAIVDEIVRAHGGTIELTREDDRTVVRIGLPVSRY